MDDFLDSCIPKLSFTLPFIKKYVNYLITAISFKQINKILSAFNNYDSNIEFRVVNEHDYSVPFLIAIVVRKIPVSCFPVIHCFFWSL